MDKFFTKLFKKIKSSRRLQAISMIVVLAVGFAVFVALDMLVVPNEEVLYHICNTTEPTVTYIDQPIEIEIELPTDDSSDVLIEVPGFEGGSIYLSYFIFNTERAQNVESPYVSCVFEFVSRYERTDSGFRFISLNEIPESGSGYFRTLTKEYYENLSEKKSEDITAHGQAASSLRAVTASLGIDGELAPFNMDVGQMRHHGYETGAYGTLPLEYEDNAKIDITGLESVKLTIDGYYIAEYETSDSNVDIIKSF